MGFLRKIKNLWMAFVHVFGQVQTTLLLTLVYHLAIGPIALLGRLLRKDFLVLRPPRTPSYATELGQLSSTTERAQRQF